MWRTGQPPHTCLNSNNNEGDRQVWRTGQPPHTCLNSIYYTSQFVYKLNLTLIQQQVCVRLSCDLSLFSVLVIYNKHYKDEKHVWSNNYFLTHWNVTWHVTHTYTPEHTPQNTPEHTSTQSHLIPTSQHHFQHAHKNIHVLGSEHHLRELTGAGGEGRGSSSSSRDGIGMAGEGRGGESICTYPHVQIWHIHCSGFFVSFCFFSTFFCSGFFLSLITMLPAGWALSGRSAAAC